MTLSWKWIAALMALGAVVLVVLARCPGRQPPAPVGRVDTVPDTVLVPQRPETLPPKFITRIVKVAVPVDVNVSAGTPDTAAARRYARKVFEAESLRALLARGDTTTGREPAGMLPPVQGKWTGRQLELYLTESNGRLMKATGKLRPPFTFTAGHGGATDTVPLMVGATALAAAVRETTHCLQPAAVLAGGGAALNGKDRLLGAVLGFGTGLLGCLAD